MAPTIRTRVLIGTALATLLVVVPAPRSAADPCDETRAGGGTPPRGLQVEVDPQTGAYSMPAPGRLDDAQGRAATAPTGGVVVTPGRSAAGGFKATLGDDALVHEQAK
jgi:hypothetical protein